MFDRTRYHHLVEKRGHYVRPAKLNSVVHVANVEHHMGLDHFQPPNLNLGYGEQLH